MWRMTSWGRQTLMTVGALALGAAILSAQELPKDFSSEIRDTNAMVLQLDKYIKIVRPLEPKTLIAKVELDAAIAEGDAVKRVVPVFQRGVSSVVAKLQTAGKWTADLDVIVERRLRERGATSDVLQDLRARGGARAVLLDADRNSGEVSQQVDADLSALRSKGLARRLFDELFGTPLQAFSRFTACRVYLASKIACALGEGGSCHDAVLYGSICRDI